MKAKKEKISARLSVLLDRLKALESEDPEPHRKSIVQIGIEALRDKIREMGRELNSL